MENDCKKTRLFYISIKAMKKIAKTTHEYFITRSINFNTTPNTFL